MSQCGRTGWAQRPTVSVSTRGPVPVSFTPGTTLRVHRGRRVDRPADPEVRSQGQTVPIPAWTGAMSIPYFGVVPPRPSQCTESRDTLRGRFQGATGKTWTGRYPFLRRSVSPSFPRRYPRPPTLGHVPLRAREGAHYLRSLDLWGYLRTGEWVPQRVPLRDYPR